MKRDLAAGINIDPESWNIGEAVLKGVLLEVASFPKPGLVCPASSGAHDDMNIMTFMAGSATIAPAFYQCAQAGRDHRGSIALLLSTIREIGVFYENKLLASTKGVNTQRGILFSGGVLSGAAGYLSQSENRFSIDAIYHFVKEMTRGLVDKELSKAAAQKTTLTAGELLFQKYGVTGIRGEAEAGFPSVVEKGVPALKYALQQGPSLRDGLIHTLLSLMTRVEDSTIIWRKGRGQLRLVQKASGEILQKGSVFSREGREGIRRMDEEFKAKGISPGGSADLLAITVSSYLLENGQFPVAIT